jgi:ribosomal protein S24E
MTPSPVDDEVPVRNPDLLQDSLEWGSGAKDCKAKIYVDFKKMSDEEIKILIERANKLRIETSKEVQQ